MYDVIFFHLSYRMKNKWCCLCLIIFKGVCHRFLIMYSCSTLIFTQNIALDKANECTYQKLVHAFAKNGRVLTSLAYGIHGVFSIKITYHENHLKFRFRTISGLTTITMYHELYCKVNHQLTHYVRFSFFEV